jgi:AcrR family transcriptional regulator
MTVLRRFGSKERLFAAAAGERSKEIRADREAGAPRDVTELVAHYERWGEQQLHLLAQEARVPVVRAATDAARRYHHARTTEAFGPLLGDLPAAMRHRRLAQLTAVTDLAMWRVLRHDLRLDERETEAAVRELVQACLDGRREEA